MRQIRVNTVAREQLEKFDDYVRSMKNKVEKQREDRRKYNEIMQERLKEQQDAVRRSRVLIYCKVLKNVTFSINQTLVESLKPLTCSQEVAGLSSDRSFLTFRCFP